MNRLAERSTDNVVIFKSKIEEFETILTSYGIEKRSCPARVWEDFARCEPLAQKKILDQLQHSIAMLIYAAKNKNPSLGDKNLLWSALSFLGLVPPSNLLNQIDQGDFIEIYDSTGIQVFRNLEFYKVISYSIAEITLYPWDDLFHRDNDIKEQIYQQGFVKGFSGAQVPFSLDITPHVVKEAFSPRMVQCIVQFKILSPLFDTHRNITAVLATSKLTPDGSTGETSAYAKK